MRMIKKWKCQRLVRKYAPYIERAKDFINQEAGEESWRNAKWTTKDDIEINIYKMTNDHIINTLIMLSGKWPGNVLRSRPDFLRLIEEFSKRYCIDISNVKQIHTKEYIFGGKGGEV